LGRTHITSPTRLRNHLYVHSPRCLLRSIETVGYGDVYPLTVGGCVFTFFVLMLGLGIVSVPAGWLASALSKARELEGDDVDAASSQDRRSR